MTSRSRLPVSHTRGGGVERPAFLELEGMDTESNDDF